MDATCRTSRAGGSNKASIYHHHAAGGWFVRIYHLLRDIGGVATPSKTVAHPSLTATAAGWSGELSASFARLNPNSGV